MYIEDIIKLINHKLANELLSQTELLMHMDSVIDDINAELNAVFPTFTEVITLNQGINNPDYQAIPDKYIRSVVVLGAAKKYYEVDEEGNLSATVFATDYKQQLFLMVRDYSFSIPEQYRAKDQGFIALSETQLGAPGLTIGNSSVFDVGGEFR